MTATNHKNDLSNEFEFMLRCLREDLPLNEDELLQVEQMDWQSFIDLVKHHRVYPQVYLKLKSEAQMFEETIKPLQQIYMRNTFKMLQLTREMGNVCGHFIDHHIPLIVLKGPVLAAKLYGDISKRTSKDLDLFVCHEDIHKSISLLSELGYHMKEEKLLNNWMYKDHHFSFQHPQNLIQIELHWRLNPSLGGAPPFDYFWKRRSEVRISNQVFFCLGDEDLLLYLSEHGSRHGWSRLRWLLDIDKMLKTYSFNTLDYSLKQYKVQQYLAQAVILSQRLISSEIPTDMRSLAPYPITHQRLEKVIEIIKGAVHTGHNTEYKYDWNFFVLMSSKQKLDYIRMLCTPSSKDALILPLPKKLHFLYFPLRPFLWLVRRIKQQRLETVK